MMAYPYMAHLRNNFSLSMNEAATEKKESASNVVDVRPNSKPSASEVSTGEAVGASAPVS